jgi:tRNA A58 N-methylase Trm61
MSASRLLFGGAIFGASMAAKQLLPAFGGSAAVWMTCLVFFQLVLLAGYSYAHWMTRPAARAWQVGLHVGLLVLAVVSAVGWAGGWMPLRGSATNPVGAIFVGLAVRIGLPFLILGSTSPLLQVWFFRVEGSGIPYRLFALSNLASLLALFLYPTVIEPHLTLRTQRWAWAAGVVVFAGLSATLAWRTRSRGIVEEMREDAAATSWRRWGLWFLLPMAASMQLSAVTSHLTTNIAAIPLLWIVPLAMYLLSFILAFESPRFYQRPIMVRLLVVMLAGLGYVLSHADVSFPMSVTIGFFLVELFLAALLCHAEAYRLRPARASETTVFYLLVAAGGAMGSFLIGIGFPLVFVANYDLSLSFLATAVVVLLVTWQDGATTRLLWSTVSVLLLVLVFALRVAYQRDTLMATRNFYGSLRVRQTISQQGDPLRTLLNGSIQHGTEIFSPALMRTPTTYYAPDSGIGLAMAACCEGRGKRVGVVGLGAGTLAAYGSAGDRVRFYELNPAVGPIARNLFTYLRDSPAEIRLVEGDARASMVAEEPQGFDVLVVDAFSGDAIPLHLLTVEAMAVYRRHLAQGGVLAFHVSNQYVNLEPEIGELALAAGMEARRVGSIGNERRGEFAATWVLVSDAGFFQHPQLVDRVTRVERQKGVVAWTDDYSSLLPLVRW